MAGARAATRQSQLNRFLEIPPRLSDRRYLGDRPGNSSTNATSSSGTFLRSPVSSTRTPLPAMIPTAVVRSRTRRSSKSLRCAGPGGQPLAHGEHAVTHASPERPRIAMVSEGFKSPLRHSQGARGSRNQVTRTTPVRCARTCRCDRRGGDASGSATLASRPTQPAGGLPFASSQRSISARLPVASAMLVSAAP